MSGLTLLYYAKMALVASSDLILGYGVAYITNKWWAQNTKIKPEDSQDKRGFMSTLYACGQATSTIFLGDELRNLLYPKDFEDPTGGVIFMVSLLQQPLLWDRINAALNWMDTWWHNQFLGGVRQDDDPKTPLSELDFAETERPADSRRYENNRLEQVGFRDSHMKQGVPATALDARGSSSRFELSSF